MNRIICIGNRYLDSDAAGPKVFDALASIALPENVEIVDGGTAGLNLLGMVDGSERVVFVDAIAGFLPQRGVTVLAARDIPPPATTYDHAAGLPYLLHIVPTACDRAPASMFVVGIEGVPDDDAVEAAVRTSIRLACGPSGDATGANP